MHAAASSHDHGGGLGRHQEPERPRPDRLTRSPLLLDERPRFPTQLIRDCRVTVWLQTDVLRPSSHDQHQRHDRQDAHDDVLVVASQGLPRKIAQRFSTFDTSRLMPYDPRYLAGWRAEEYAVELGEAWTEAQQTIEQEQYARCGRDVPGDTHRGLQVQNQYSAETFKHVLLPLWIASYRYGDKPYRFLVNGQTGEVQGEAPISWVKVTLFVLMILLVIVGIVIALKAR